MLQEALDNPYHEGYIALADVTLRFMPPTELIGDGDPDLTWRLSIEIT